MKNRVKLICLILIALIISVFFSSCDYIDEMKAKRVDYTEDESVVVFNKKEYYLLENTLRRSINMSDYDRLYAAKEDLPLLLLEDFGEYAQYSSGIEVIKINGNYYCLKDKYDYYSEILEKGVTDSFRSYRQVWDEDEHYHKTEYYVIDKKTTDLIKGTLDKAVGFEVEDINGLEYLHLDSCDEANLVVEEDTVQLYHDTKNGKYGILLTDYSNDRLIAKEFPEEGSALIEKLFVEANNMYYDYYEESDYEVY